MGSTPGKNGPMQTAPMPGTLSGTVSNPVAPPKPAPQSFSPGFMPPQGIDEPPPMALEPTGGMPVFAPNSSNPSGPPVDPRAKVLQGLFGSNRMGAR